MTKKIIINEDFLKKITFRDIEDLDYVISKQLLDEGLVKSYDADSIIRMFNKRFANSGYSYNIFKYKNTPTSDDVLDFENESTLIVKLERSSPKEFIGEIKKFMRTCGWLITQDLRIDDNDQSIILEFDPKFATDATQYVRSHMNVLYHAAPNKVVDKILKQGLTPRESTNGYFQYDGRVYLMMGDELSPTQVQIMDNVIDYHKKMGKDEYNNGYSILMINLNKVPEDVKFYIDAAACDAVYTRNTIPPQAITIWKTAYYNKK